MEAAELATLIAGPINTRMDDIKDDIKDLKDSNQNQFDALNERLSDLEDEVSDIKKNGVSTRPCQVEDTALTPKNAPWYRDRDTLTIVALVVVCLAALAVAYNRNVEDLVLPTHSSGETQK